MRATDPITSISNQQFNENNPILPPKLCKNNIQRKSSSLYKCNLPNRMTLKSIHNTHKMELNIPLTPPYSVNIERTLDNTSESKYYMLSKHHNNKTSIIDDVVSKIPTVITLPPPSSKGAREPCSSKINYPTSNTRSIKCATLPKLLKISNKNASNFVLHESNAKRVSIAYILNYFKLYS